MDDLDAELTRPGVQPPPEHQDARPPERAPQSLSVLADADLSGPSVVRALPPPPPLLAPLKTEYAWTARPFVSHPVPRNAQVVTLVDEPTRDGGYQGDRACRGHNDQIGGRRCVRCCTARDLSYVWRKPAGGSPGGWRYLCPECMEVYEALGLVGDPRTHVNAFTDGYAARTGVGLDTGLNRFGQFKDAAAVSA